MKRIIDGKVYNTDTAKMVATYKNYGSWRDFKHFEEELYQKKTGEYFLFGAGGPASRYAEETGLNTWTGGEKIIPLTVKDAMEWAEKHLEADEYESIFGAVEEDTSKRMVTMYLRADVAESLRRIASECGVSVGAVVEGWVLDGKQ